jgi:hypothetical protein
MLTMLVSRLSLLLFAAALSLPMLVSAQSADKPFTNAQLDQMLAQVALYPDPLLSQLLMASTYPEEFAEATAWSKARPDSKGDAAVKAVESKDWDPSVASMVAFPEVLITLGEKPDYVKSLGDAFLAQPEDVMDSVQRLRVAAQKAGNLTTNEQIRVSTEAATPAPAATTTTVVVQQAAPPPQVIVIQPAQPSVVYVPAYNPTLVYGPWMYPSYPPYYYPPPPGYWFSRTVATGIAWGIGIGVSNALWGGFAWGRGDVNINVNRYNSINVNNRIDVNSSNRSSWSHDPGHRKADYRGGDAQRQSLERRSQASGREAYRGKDVARDAGGDGVRDVNRDGTRDVSRDGARDASRDASRDKAQQAMAQRGVDGGAGAARDRTQGADRGAAQDRAQGAGRDATRDKAPAASRDAARQTAEKADRDAARDHAVKASQDNALKGAGDRQAKQQIDRGAASQNAAQRPDAGGARPTPVAARPSPVETRPAPAAARPAPAAARPAPAPSTVRSAPAPAARSAPAGGGAAARAGAGAGARGR